MLSALYFISRANRLLGVSSTDYGKYVIFPGLVPYLVALIFTAPAILAVRYTSRVGGAMALVLIGVAYTVLLVGIVDRAVFEAGERLWFHALVQQRFGRFLPRRGVVHP